MDKFLTIDFLYVAFLVLILLIAHEYGHYLAYKVLGIPAQLRQSFFAPGIDPKNGITVNRWKGMLIAFSGFIFSSITVNFPLYLLGHKHWFVLFLGSIAGSIVDFIWALSMMGSKEIHLHSRQR